MNVLVAMKIMFWMKIRIVFHVQIWKKLEEQDVKTVNIYNLKIKIYVKKCEIDYIYIKNKQICVNYVETLLSEYCFVADHYEDNDLYSCIEC